MRPRDTKSSEQNTLQPSVEAEADFTYFAPASSSELTQINPFLSSSDNILSCLNEPSFNFFEDSLLPEIDLETNKHPLSPFPFPHTSYETKPTENKTLSTPFSSLSFVLPAPVTAKQNVVFPEPIQDSSFRKNALPEKHKKRKTPSTQIDSVEPSEKKKQYHQTHTADLTEIQKILPNFDSDDYLVFALLSEFCSFKKTKIAGSHLDQLVAHHLQDWNPERIILALKSITPAGISSLFPLQDGDTIPEPRKQLKVKAHKFVIKFQQYFINQGWILDDFDIRHWGVNHPFSRDTPRDEAIQEATQLQVERRKNRSSFHSTFFTTATATTSSLINENFIIKQTCENSSGFKTFETIFKNPTTEEYQIFCKISKPDLGTISAQNCTLLPENYRTWTKNKIIERIKSMDIEKIRTHVNSWKNISRPITGREGDKEKWQLKRKKFADTVIKFLNNPKYKDLTTKKISSQKPITIPSKNLSHEFTIERPKPSAHDSTEDSFPTPFTINETPFDSFNNISLPEFDLETNKHPLSPFPFPLTSYEIKPAENKTLSTPFSSLSFDSPSVIDLRVENLASLSAPIEASPPLSTEIDDILASGAFDPFLSNPLPPSFLTPTPQLSDPTATRQNMFFRDAIPSAKTSSFRKNALPTKKQKKRKTISTQDNSVGASKKRKNYCQKKTADLTEIQKILPNFDSDDYLVLAILSQFCRLKTKKIAGSHLEELVARHAQKWNPERITLALQSITPEGISSLFPIQNGDTIPEPRKQLKEKAHKFVNKFQKHFRSKGWTPDDFDIRHWGVNHPFSRDVPRVKAIEEAKQLKIDRRKNPSSSHSTFFTTATATTSSLINKKTIKKRTLKDSSGFKTFSTIFKDPTPEEYKIFCKISKPDLETISAKYCIKLPEDYRNWTKNKIIECIKSMDIVKIRNYVNSWKNISSPITEKAGDTKKWQLKRKKFAVTVIKFLNNPKYKDLTTNEIPSQKPITTPSKNLSHEFKIERSKPSAHNSTENSFPTSFTIDETPFDSFNNISLPEFELETNKHKTLSTPFSSLSFASPSVIDLQVENPASLSAPIEASPPLSTEIDDILASGAFDPFLSNPLPPSFLTPTPNPLLTETSKDLSRELKTEQSNTSAQDSAFFASSSLPSPLLTPSADTHPLIESKILPVERKNPPTQPKRLPAKRNKKATTMSPSIQNIFISNGFTLDDKMISTLKYNKKGTLLQTSIDNLLKSGFNRTQISKILPYEKSSKTLQEKYDTLKALGFDNNQMFNMAKYPSGDKNLNSVIDNFQKLIESNLSLLNMVKMASQASGFGKIEYFVQYKDKLLNLHFSEQQIINLFSHNSGKKCYHYSIKAIIDYFPILRDLNFTNEQLILLAKLNLKSIMAIVKNKKELKKYQFTPEKILDCRTKSPSGNYYTINEVTLKKELDKHRILAEMKATHSSTTQVLSSLLAQKNTLDQTASSSQQQSTPHVEPRVFNPTSPRLGIRFWEQPKQPSTQIEPQDSCLTPRVDPQITRGPK
jgi:hypothetical protein